MMNFSKHNNVIDDDDDVKIVLPVSTTSTQQLLDVSGNKIGEVELNTFEDFAYASESTATIIERVVWGEQDTTFLLEKYELYICEVGPRKRFHSKKHMWNQIANDIYYWKNMNYTFVNTSEEDKNGTTSTTEESTEADALKNEGLQMHFERLEQTNQELTQQIEQCSIRVLTMVERLEKHHTRQQQRFEKAILENKDQLRTNFTTLFEKLDSIHSSIQKNQEHQQQLIEKLIENKQEEQKKEFTAILNILDKIHASTKQDVIKRSRSRSNSRRKRSQERSSCSSPKTKRRFHSPHTRSRSNSKSNYKSPVSHSSRRSRSNDRYNSASHISNISFIKYVNI
ncbi:hypothetical protein QE152_g32567 [Popillia japonica]|uniref:Uncharacterized protein n=1 Tax=Popillia japonica TaxID=7064 RepID=A0AAW1IYR1_POPJA